MKTVLVLALNPSIDAEWQVDDILWEEKNNVRSETRWAGGKGINVARWLNHLKCKTELILPLGGLTGNELAGYLRKEKLPVKIIPIHQAARVNVIVTTRRGCQMRFNPLGPHISSAEWAKTFRDVERALPQSALLVLSGSLPRGVAVDAYARLIRHAREHAVKTLLDCDGTPFVAGIKARPFLVKPNQHELALWFGKKLRHEKDIVTAAKALSVLTGGWVLVSCGGERSHLVHAKDGITLTAKPEKVTPRNTVGAGDALLAAVATEIVRGSPPLRWLQRGIEIGTAATQQQAGKLPSD